jgi:predicted RND superfamily exporter protein
MCSLRGAKIVSIFVLIGWSVVIYFGIVDGLEFFNNTHWNLASPPESPSNLAKVAFSEHLPHFFETMPFKGVLVMSTRTKGKSVLTPTIEQFVTKFSTLANNNSLPAPWKCFNRRVDSYYSFATNEEREAARARFVMPGNETTLLFITTNAGVPNSAKYLYFDKLQAEIDAFLKTDKGQDYEISMTYEQLLLRDAKNNAIGDFEKGDMITLPISFLILFMVVGMPAFLVLFTLASAGLGGFLILTPFAKGWHEAVNPHKIHRVNFASFTPSVFICCLIALSLDYALFILVRYQEEDRKTTEDMRAVKITFMTAGKVVLLSGSILASAFIGLAFVDFEMISSIGFGGAIMIGSAVLANLTLMPSFLILFGPCFRSNLCRCRWQSSFCRRSNFGKPSLELKDAYSELNGTDPEGHTMPSSTSKSTFQQKAYYHMGRFAQKHSVACSIFMLMVTVPFLFVVLSMNITTDQSLIVPRNAPSLVAFKQLKERGISGGIMSPFLVLAGATKPQTDKRIKALPCADDDEDVKIQAIRHGVEFIDSCTKADLFGKLEGLDICKRPKNGKEKKLLQGIDVHKLAANLCQGTCVNYCTEDRNRLFADDFFDTLIQFRKAVVDAAGKNSLSEKSFTDITTLEDGTILSPSEAFEILQKNFSDSSALDKLYKDKFNQLANYERNFALLQIVPDGSTFDAAGLDALKIIRKVASMDRFKQYGFQLASDVATIHDSTDEVYRETPTVVLTIVVLIVFVLSGFAFRSFLIACRLLATISVTVIIVLGITVLIFDSFGTGIYWMIPVCCIPLIIGLTLDYDTFLVSRIFEFRHQGYTSEAAILKGLEESGPSITYAGIIMAVAFSALILSNEYVLNQFGTVLVVSSLVDTFFVRALFVPALMFLGGDKFIWWPGKPPVPHITMSEDGELFDEEKEGNSLSQSMNGTL